MQGIFSEDLTNIYFSNFDAAPFGQPYPEGPCVFIGWPGMQQTMTIAFNQEVANLSFYLGIAHVGLQPDGDTFTIQDDQGHTQQVTLARYSIPGHPAAWVFLPYQHVRRVTITALGTSLGWGFYIDNVTYTPTGSLAILDPVPDLLNGNQVSTDPQLLAAAGRPVTGVAADSAARLALRLSSNTNGDQLQLALLNDLGQPSNSPVADGTLTSINGQVVGAQLQLTATDAGSGPMAFALYTPPSDFSRGGADDTAPNRSVFLQLKSLTSGQTLAVVPVTLWRPPVVLVHGLWGSPADWDTFVGLTLDPQNRFVVRRANYSLPTSVVASVPSYPLPLRSLILSNATTSALGFSYNAPTVLQDIEVAISVFRITQNAAAAQADVVAHSMGGLVTRTLVKAPRYLSADGFGKGRVHKLITIGTPHLGSPVATQLLNGNTNVCTRNWLALFRNVSFAEATMPDTSTTTGGVGDLQDGSLGGGLSLAPNAIQSGAAYPVPTALVAGIMSQSNLSGLAFAAAPLFLGVPCQGEPLANALTPSGWRSIFGEDSDGIVPLTSQTNGFGGPFTFGVVHSPGTTKLGFNGPSELDVLQPTNDIQNQVIQLLNAPLRSPSFYLLP